MEVVKEYTVNELLNDNKVLRNVGQIENGEQKLTKNLSHIISYNIPDSISSLDHYCFYGCYNLSSITIPDTISNLGHCCFSQCYKLSSITIPNSVTSLGSDCFYSCSNLSSITIPDSVSSLGDECFVFCSKLTSITLGNSVTSLGKACFSGCYNLNSITIPNSVSSLGDHCFSNCTNLSSITIPDSVIHIGLHCFNNCTNLSSITIPEHLLSQLVLSELNKNCKIITYKSNQKPKHKPKKVQKEVIEIEPIKINPPQITEDYNPNLLEYNEYIKERTELLETYQNKSVVKYHESIIDIAEDFNENVKVKQLELQEYSKVIQTYSNNLSEISSNLTKKINQHTQKLKEIEENNYKLPELNTIKDRLNKIVLTVEDDDFNQTIVLNDNYCYKDDLIIPKTNNPYTEIYKLPCDFIKVTPENKRILAKSEKKIALLSIEYEHEYIDLSNTDIQYFIDTFKNCPNLKEIRYPQSKEN